MAELRHLAPKAVVVVFVLLKYPAVHDLKVSLIVGIILVINCCNMAPMSSLLASADGEIAVPGGSGCLVEVLFRLGLDAIVLNIDK